MSVDYGKLRALGLNEGVIADLKLSPSRQAIYDALVRATPAEIAQLNQMHDAISTKAALERPEELQRFIASTVRRPETHGTGAS